ncbi:MAG: sulfatase-like hydrolase/transferase [Phycisphaerae bacterium]
MSKTPNIVLLMTDQQKASATGIYGNTCVPSAFQDRMAGEGVTFMNAFSASPICTPSRASIMTGVHPLVHQSTCHQDRVPWNLVQFPELLQRAGYYTTACGHYERNRNLDRGYHEQISYQDPGLLSTLTTQIFSLGRCDVGWSSGTVPIAAEKGLSAALTDRTIEMLDNIAATKAPFFLHLAYQDPHPPYFVPSPYDTMVDPGAIDLPPRADIEGCPAWQFKALVEAATAKASELDIRKVISIYYGMIAYANDQMRRLYEVMSQRGMLDNTWFILAADHGDYAGEKGLFNKTESLYECLLHVPLIIRPPDNISCQRGRKVQGLVELTDVFSTICGIANIKAPDYVQSHDLVRWVNDGANRPLRDCAFAQVGDYHGHLGTTFPIGMPKSGRHASLVQGARNLEFSYARDPDNGDEAYDLRSDPHELNNLLNPGKHSCPKMIDTLREQVDQWESRCVRLREKLGVVRGERRHMEPRECCADEASDKAEPTAPAAEGGKK